MLSCPVCGHEDVIFSGKSKYEVEGRPTALCPHAEAHGREGKAFASVRYFTDTGEVLGPTSHRFWEVLYAAGVQMGIEEGGRRFGAPFLFEHCGVRGLRKSEVLSLAADGQLAPLLPKLKVMEESEREGWPVLLAPLFDPHGLCGLEVRYFAPPSMPRPGESPSRGPGRMIRTVGNRGVYLSDPYTNPRVVVAFEGIWDCITAHWDAFERDSHEFAFVGITANTGASLIRETLKTFFPGVPVVVVGDRDRAGIQAMAKLRRCFPAAILQGVVATEGKAPKDYREADPDRRWQALLTGIEAGLEEWDRRKLGGDPNGHPVILVRPPEHEVVAQAWSALKGQGEVFVRGDRLVHVVHSAGEITGNIKIPPGNPIVYEATQYWLRDHLSRGARFQRESAEGQVKESMVPEWLPQVLLASPHSSGLPRFKGLVEVPVMLADGSILMEEGLYPGSGVYLAATGPLPILQEAPGLQEAKEAAEKLFELVADFPFGSNPHPEVYRAAWLAFLLTGFARFAIPGPVPFVLVDASSPSSGKWLLTQLAAIIIQGHNLAIALAPKTGEEMQKMALAALRQGHRLFYLDEVPNPFGSREWNGLMTAYPDYQGRVLGLSTMIQVPQLTLWIVSGNNVTLAPDVSRRCLHLRLEPLTERPEDRDGFRIPDLLEHVRERRTELAGAALTILQAYHQAGRPSFGLKPWGSFEAWSKLVRNAVFWVTGRDCDTRSDLASRADNTKEAWGTVLTELRAVHGTRPFTSEQVLALCAEDGLSDATLRTAIEALNMNPKGLCGRSLGWILHRHEKVVVSGSYLTRHAGKHKGSWLWVIESVPSEIQLAS